MTSLRVAVVLILAAFNLLSQAHAKSKCAQALDKINALDKKVAAMLSEMKEQLLTSIEDQLRNFTEDNNFSGPGKPSFFPALAYDCLDILEKDIGTTDGVYSVKLRKTGEVIQVYCDMTSDGGGWTVFQKRFNGNVDFYRNFNDYENGFGSVYGEYWLGLKYIYLMTTGLRNGLRLDLERAYGQTAYEVYKDFYLSNSPSYSLHIGSSSGTAGDSGLGLSYRNRKSFSAFAMDQDPSIHNCAVKDHGGWWYDNCAYAHVNGEYITPGTRSTYHNGEGGVTYRKWSSYESL